jgi:hypothetical protein
MTDNKWIENIKVNDEVIVKVDGNPVSISRVVRLTKTKIIVSKSAHDYRRLNYDAGNAFSGTGWNFHSHHISEATPVALELARSIFKKKNTLRRIEATNFTALSIDKLVKIENIIMDNKEAKS